MATKKQKKRQEKKRRHQQQLADKPAASRPAAGKPVSAQNAPGLSAGPAADPGLETANMLAGQPGPAWQPLCRLLVKSYLAGYEPLEKKPRRGG
ncbi:MAG: hypothetical protein ACUVTU_10660 [Desulfurispora sp.]|uniref:hypothetical protein n=1 Tax=Desulfurispora sp. TaxID=3014275 RepID=UPI00404993B7